MVTFTPHVHGGGESLASYGSGDSGGGGRAARRAQGRQGGQVAPAGAKIGRAHV